MQLYSPSTLNRIAMKVRWEASQSRPQQLKSKALRNSERERERERDRERERERENTKKGTGQREARREGERGSEKNSLDVSLWFFYTAPLFYMRQRG